MLSAIKTDDKDKIAEIFMPITHFFLLYKKLKLKF